MSLFRNINNKILPRRISTAFKALCDPKFCLSIDEITYNQDRLVTAHNCDFINDVRFLEAYKKGEETGSWGNAKIHWRAFVACWAADRAINLEGDFVECGVNRGGLSRAVMQYVEFDKLKDKKFYLLDTYEGLHEKYITDEEKELGRESGGYEECYESVKRTFAAYENAIIIKGAVPETLPEIKAEKISYLSIDMNCVEPEIAAANFMWDKLTSGATIILDDYGWSEHIIQKRAFDEFAQLKNVPILSLPTGQGLILKP